MSGPGSREVIFFQGPQIGHDFRGLGGGLELTTIGHFRGPRGGAGLAKLIFLRTFLEKRVGPGLAKSYFFQGSQIGHDFRGLGGGLELTTVAHFHSLGEGPGSRNLFFGELSWKIASGPGSRKVIFFQGPQIDHDFHGRHMV